MRKLEYLSPTSISLFYENTTEFYLNYLAGDRAPRFPQTQPMSVGSAFDAYVKADLYEKLVGKNDPKFERKALFEAQVEPHNRDWAWVAGAYAFMEYKRSGAYGDLMLELQGSISTPRFELEVRGVVDGKRDGMTRQFGDVPLLGKPDLAYINKDGANVIHDWKVNGFCSKYNTSPMQGYVRLRVDGYNKGQHKNAQLLPFRGMMLNVSGSLEDFDKNWARQLAIYGWLCGHDVGGDFVVSVDQLVCKPDLNCPDMPGIRVAAHRLKIRPQHQWAVYEQAQHVWEVVNSNHIFRDISLAESQERCALLDRQASELKGNGSDDDQWFSQVTRVR